MKIAIDIDNTICNTSNFYGPLAKQYDREVLHKNSNIDYDKILPRSPEWTQQELSYFVESIFNKESINIPIKEDASLYINKLKELGYIITFITYRGMKDDDFTDLIIPEYLKKNNIPYDNIITKTKDKYKYLDDCDYFIDDGITNCEEAIKYSNSKVIMMSSNTNKEYYNDKIIKVNNWQEIYEYIKSEVD